MHEKRMKRPLRQTDPTEMHAASETAEENISEDAEDLAAFEERSDEALISFEEMVKKLKESGRTAK